VLVVALEQVSVRSFALLAVAIGSAGGERL
jgi:hypothetical protein